MRAQQPLWPHAWRPAQLEIRSAVGEMPSDALHYRQGKREVTISLHEVTHVNVVDNERCEMRARHSLAISRLDSSLDSPPSTS